MRRRVTATLGDFRWRPLTDSAADTEFVVRLRNDSRFAPWFYNQRVTPETHQKFIRAADERGEVNWLIERAEDSGKPLGLASIYNFDAANRKAECGRIAAIEPRVFHLNWVMSAHVAMDVIGTNKLYIETLEDNRIIARAVERMGMVREGLLRAHVIRAGQPLNVLLYSNTNDEWQAMKEKHFSTWGVPQIISFEGEQLR
ncbi:MAG: hypothetical protein QOF78_2714 [Phycisphaerales bacterium]|nr:hypothetical protein [Phycisphaerales bacterium]